MTLITSLTVVKYQHNSTSLWKKHLEAAQVMQQWESILAFLRVKKWLLQDIIGGGTITTITAAEKRAFSKPQKNEMYTF